MAENKTQPTKGSPRSYLESLPTNATTRDALRLLELIASLTNAEPVMWGTSIIGYGVHHYTYESGRTGTTPAVGFAVRGQRVALYGLREAVGAAEALVTRLGPHQEGKGCLYLSSLDQIDTQVFSALVTSAFLARDGVASD